MPPTPPPWLIEAVKKLVKKYGWAAVLWIAQRLGLSQVAKLSSRQNAIKKARSTREGRFAAVLVEGELRYVIFSGERPVDAFPPVAGDLTELLSDFNRHGLRAPDELHIDHAKRWLRDHLPGAAKHPPAPTEKPAEAVPSNGAAKFAETAECLPALLERLTSSPAKQVREHDALPNGAGLYLFSEGPAPMYVGQTRNLKQRLRQHTSASSRENQRPSLFALLRRQRRVTAWHSAARGSRRSFTADC